MVTLVVAALEMGFVTQDAFALDPNPISNNFYERLGVSQTATQDEIKSAYRKAAKAFHPDGKPGPLQKLAEQAFKRVQEAYDTLSDPDQRRIYDMNLNRAGSESVSPRRATSGGRPPPPPPREPPGLTADDLLALMKMDPAQMSEPGRFLTQARLLMNHPRYGDNPHFQQAVGRFIADNIVTFYKASPTAEQVFQMRSLFSDPKDRHRILENSIRAAKSAEAAGEMIYRYLLESQGVDSENFQRNIHGFLDTYDRKHKGDQSRMELFEKWMGRINGRRDFATANALGKMIVQLVGEVGGARAIDIFSEALQNPERQFLAEEITPHLKRILKSKNLRSYAETKLGQDNVRVLMGETKSIFASLLDGLRRCIPGSKK